MDSRLTAEFVSSRQTQLRYLAERNRRWQLMPARRSLPSLRRSAKVESKAALVPCCS